MWLPWKTWFTYLIFEAGHFLSKARKKKKISRDNTYLLCLLNNHANDYSKQSAKDPIKTSSKRVLQKTAEATGDLIVAKLCGRSKKFTTKCRMKTLTHWVIFEPANSVNALYVILTILLTISASSADCKWEFFSINLEKTYLKSEQWSIRHCLKNTCRWHYI